MTELLMPQVEPVHFVEAFRQCDENGPPSGVRIIAPVRGGERISGRLVFEVEQRALLCESQAQSARGGQSQY
jgi:hypothetical protein